MVIAEQEYDTAKTLLEFAATQLAVAGMVQFVVLGRNRPAYC